MASSSLLGELVPRGGGDPIPLFKTPLLVGRRNSCDISLQFPNVSSHHCQMDLQNGYWFIRDLGSRNGIKVNGIRCDQKFLLPGDEISIAKHRYEVIYEPDGDEPPPQDEDPFQLSLMEKAGLTRRRERQLKQQEEVELPPPVRPLEENKTSNGPRTEEDDALGYLLEDDP